MNLRKQVKGLSGRARRVQAAMKGLGGIYDLNLVGAPKRPEPMDVGQVIRGEFKVEQLLRSSDFKHDYVVSCVEGSVAAKRCWECGDENSYADSSYCVDCGMPLAPRVFLLSERWRGRVEPYRGMTEARLQHASLARYYDVFMESERLFVLCDLAEGDFMGTSLNTQDADVLTRTACQLAEALLFLEEQGVRVSSLSRDSVSLIGDSAVLIDPELALVVEGREPQRFRSRLIENLGQVLRQYAPYDAVQLRRFIDELCEGRADNWNVVINRLGELARQAVEGRQVDGELAIAAMSDVGMMRALNEDIWGWERIGEDLALFAVADGMGGHDNGEVASDLAVRTLMSGVRERLEGRRAPSIEMLEALLDAGSQGANNAVKAFSEQRRTDMGTTLVSALIYGHEMAFVANVGDSRAYLFRRGQLSLISRDHSLVANLVSMGKITPEAARNHPHSNILVRTVGKEWDVEIDVFRQPLQPGDAILLASDGLWGEVEDSEIAAIMNEFADPRVACREMISTANQHGGRDNITVILIIVPSGN